MLEYVARDEKKHTGLAVLYLPSILKKVGFVEARDSAGAPDLLDVLHVAVDLGSPPRSGRARHRHPPALRRGIDAQDRLVEAMGIRRGIFKSKTLENLVLSMYKPRSRKSQRGQWTSQPSRTWSSR